MAVNTKTDRPACDSVATGKKGWKASTNSGSFPTTFCRFHRDLRSSKETQVESCENEHDAGIQHQPLENALAKEGEIKPHYDGDHRANVNDEYEPRGAGCHSRALSRATSIGGNDVKGRTALWRSQVLYTRFVCGRHFEVALARCFARSRHARSAFVSNPTLVIRYVFHTRPPASAAPRETAN